PTNARRSHTAASGTHPFLAQHLPQDLPDIALGQVLPKIDVPRYLVRRQRLAAEIDQGTLGKRRVLAYHIQGDNFPGMLIRLSNGSGLQYARVTRGDGLDLVGINVEARYQDHVLLAILDEHVAALVHAADVPGA